MYDDVRIIALADLDPHQGRQFGAKAANLGGLIAAGLSVPPGVVIGREVLAHYLSENGIDLTALERTHSLGMVFFESAVHEAQVHHARIIDAVMNGTFPAAFLEQLNASVMPLMQHRLAVRSSCTIEDAATASFAGQYATVLGVSGLEEVLAAIRICWASQYDGRVLKYAISRRGLPVLVPSMAVLIQQMLTPDHAGVCFTEGPTPKTRHVSVIESVPGLGEQLVSGARTPHYFEVDTQGTVVARRIPRNDLTDPPDDEAIQAVALAARGIAAHFGTPQDVEWAVVAGKVYILQARPISVLGRAAKTAAVVLPSTAGPRPGAETTSSSGKTEAVYLREDLHEWMLEQIDPTLLRGAAFIVRNQRNDGSWEIDGYPEWNTVSTALIVSLILDGGVPATCKWITDQDRAGGPAIALSWLASQVKSDDTWGTDLWDTCQVVRTLLRCGVRPEESLLRNASDRVREELLNGTPGAEGPEWFGAGFFAAALQMFLESGATESAKQCTNRLIALQAPSGEFAGSEGSVNGDRVPSEWHTAQVISALSRCDDSRLRPALERARSWLLDRQQSDGSWGAPDGPYTHFKVFFTAYAVLALLDSATEDEGAVAKACRWLKQRQTAAGHFGDIASSLMAVAALQRHSGAAFSLRIPIATLMRIQAFLSASLGPPTHGSMQ